MGKELKKEGMGTSLVLQWLTSSAGDVRSIPGLRTKIPHATQHGKLGSPQVLLGVAKKIK